MVVLSDAMFKPSRVPDVGVREATRVLRELGAVRVSFVMPPYVSFWG